MLPSFYMGYPQRLQQVPNCCLRTTTDRRTDLSQSLLSLWVLQRILALCVTRKFNSSVAALYNPNLRD